MRYAVDDHLIEEARALLGTTNAEETIEASLREVIQSRMTVRTLLRTNSDVREFVHQALQPLSEEEIARRQIAGNLMDQVRVRVGSDFNVADEIRRLRDSNFADEDEQDVQA